jgi:hypothetical protein
MRGLQRAELKGEVSDVAGVVGGKYLQKRIIRKSKAADG